MDVSLRHGSDDDIRTFFGEMVPITCNCILSQSFATSHPTDPNPTATDTSAAIGSRRESGGQETRRTISISAPPSPAVSVKAKIRSRLIFSSVLASPLQPDFPSYGRDECNALPDERPWVIPRPIPERLGAPIALQPVSK